MHAPSTKVELLPVTQADREAAAALRRKSSDGEQCWLRAADCMAAGQADASWFVQAFARHRLAHSSHGGEELREALVRALDANVPVGQIDARTRGVIIANVLARYDSALASPPPVDRAEAGRKLNGFRCHNCKSIAWTARDASPARCGYCRCRDFSAVYPSGDDPKLPVGMKEWLGGDEPPADWGAPYLLRNGHMFDPGHNSAGPNWTASNGDIIAYTPKPAAQPLEGLTSGERWKLVPVGEPVTLTACPPGPFSFNGSLGFKTEYGAAKWLPDRDAFTVSHWPDPYCLDSGEAFWGGVSGQEARAALVVQPLAASPSNHAGSVGEAEA